MIGKSFQPGVSNEQGPNGSSRPSGGSGVQEAIKVLSLRLPKVVGAQASVPMPLLTSQGSGGNPRVDSVVNQVMSRMGSQAPPTPAAQPTPAGNAPNFQGEVGGMYGASQPAPSWSPQPQAQPYRPPSGFTPRVVIGDPPTAGTDADLGNLQRGGPGMIAPFPDVTLPPPPAPAPNQDVLAELMRIINGHQGGGGGGGFDQSLI